MRAGDRSAARSFLYALATVALVAAGCTLSTSLDGLNDYRAHTEAPAPPDAGSEVLEPTVESESGIATVDAESVAPGDDAEPVIDAAVEDPCPDGACGNSLCSNGQWDGDETAIDCGGSCAPCATGRRCVQASDCASKVCTAVVTSRPEPSPLDADVPEGEAPDGAVIVEDDASDAPEDKVCHAPECTDRVMNGSESDVDCGGSCPRCLPGARCGSWIDCNSSVCTNERCAVPSCTDGVKNGDETGVDCGAGCPKCPTGQGCLGGSDCLSGACEGSVCKATSCTDHVKNGAETDIDCGGGTCPKCGNGYRCATKTDCQSGQCAGGTCRNGF
jgi:hypothetical protein